MHSGDTSLGGSVGFVKASMVIKCALFGQISALGVSHAIMEKQIPIAASLRRPYLIRESMIFDTEIEGDDNVEVFRELWEARNARQPLANILGIHRHATSVAFTTEQDEPLLLLPDYVAGLVHAVKSNAGLLSASQISDTVAQRLYERLSRLRKYAEIVEPFSYRYHGVFPNLDEEVLSMHSDQRNLSNHEHSDDT